MSKISEKRRKFEIKKRQKRRKKLKKLKEKYLLAKSKEEKEKILEKMRRISPYFRIEEISGEKGN
jgi:hypothetical protein